MPRYLKGDGTKVPNVQMQKAWIVIPITPQKGGVPKDEETYLIPTRVADYIEKLENKIGLDKLPTIPNK